MTTTNQIMVELQDWLGDDRSISESAWTSSTTYQGKKKKTDEDVVRIVKELASSGHGVPFESVIFRFWIRMPIFTDRQHMTHRIASQNGMSGRYRTMPDEWYAIPQDVVDIFNKTYGSDELVTWEIDWEYNNLCHTTNDFYRHKLEYLKLHEKEGKITNAEYKRAREVLRGVLPQANMTERTCIMNLRSFANYQKQRNDSHAQPEIRLVAEQMLKQVEDNNICPIAIESLKAKDWVI